MTVSKTTKPLAVVSFSPGGESYLLPSADALKLVTLMQGAVTLREEFGSRLNGYKATYVIQGSPEIEVKTVTAAQIVPAATEKPKKSTAGSILALGMDRTTR